MVVKIRLWIKIPFALMLLFSVTTSINLSSSYAQSTDPGSDNSITTRCGDVSNTPTTNNTQGRGDIAVVRCSDQNANNPTIPTIERVSFICDESNNAPVTIARTQRGDISVIRWVSQFFSGTGFTPEERCQKVSSRFQTYYNNGTLKYLTTGRINNQPVICAAKKQGGRCTDVLLTLEPSDDPDQVLRQLLSIRSGATTIPLSRGDSQKPLYINLDAFLNAAPAASSKPQQPQPTTPASSQPNSSNAAF